MAVVTIHSEFGAQENKVYFGFNYSFSSFLRGRLLLWSLSFLTQTSLHFNVFFHAVKNILVSVVIFLHDLWTI